MERQLQRLREQEEGLHQGHQVTLSLPEEQTIKRVVRCEAGIQRELHRSNPRTAVFAKVRLSGGKEEKLRDPL